MFTLTLRLTAGKRGAFPEHANCNGVMVISQKKMQRMPVPSHKQLGTDADSPP